MTRKETIKHIRVIAQLPANQRYDELEKKFNSLSKQQISKALLDCGVIPEEFSHSSSEEKLWAKYCDILLAIALTKLGIKSEPIKTRGNSADVKGKTSKYTIAGDAKAFRLSRTAKNQKDFKVESLHRWKGSCTYACLIAPLYQYPTDDSQIYEQAISKKITLLSYIHLKLLLDSNKNISLEKLWQFQTQFKPDKSAKKYWKYIDEKVSKVAGKSQQQLEALKKKEKKMSNDLANEGMKHWKTLINQHKKLSQQEAVKKLIKAEKIENKIKVLKKTMNNNP